MMTHEARKRKGFTLLEVLVVIGVLALLVGILLPSLHRAKVQARQTQCLTYLRSLYMAHVVYLEDHERFPELNNETDDGAWQYNYLIYDGRDFESNFGPLIDDGASLDQVRILYCPVQEDPYHSFATPENPWPVVPLLDTRSSYGRRYHLTGKTLSQLRGTPAILADNIHLPKVVESAHKTGVNVAYLDGHAQWVPDRGILTDNELGRPFSPDDNDIVEQIWDELNRGGR
jgi:prepilin-type N-terminal cleavage/methylation domain-containing protein/prepilin-type processing-associated H-X9-DG protein